MFLKPRKVEISSPCWWKVTQDDKMTIWVEDTKVCIILRSVNQGTFKNYLYIIWATLGISIKCSAYKWTETFNFERSFWKSYFWQSITFLLEIWYFMGYLLLLLLLFCFITCNWCIALFTAIFFVLKRNFEVKRCK